MKITKYWNHHLASNISKAIQSHKISKSSQIWNDLKWYNLVLRANSTHCCSDEIIVPVSAGKGLQGWHVGHVRLVSPSTWRPTCKTPSFEQFPGLWKSKPKLPAFNRPFLLGFPCCQKLAICWIQVLHLKATGTPETQLTVPTDCWCLGSLGRCPTVGNGLQLVLCSLLLTTFGQEVSLPFRGSACVKSILRTS